jgi:hypothetical protein
VHVCVVPAAAGGARLMTVAGDRIVLDETIVPDGVSRPVDEPGCRGSRKSEWSTDGQRIYASAELTCDAQAPRKVSGLTLLSSNAEWIDVQVVMAGTQENVRVRKYERSSDVPPDPALVPADLAARAARTAFGTHLTIGHVTEASRKVTPRVLEALIFETQTAFPLDSRQLIALDDAGVPDTIIDLMVAFSFPKKFEVRRSYAGSSSFGGFGGFGGFGWDPFGGDFLSAEFGSPWYYNPYYSFSPFGYSSWGYWNGYYSDGPTIEIGAGGSTSGSTEGHGRVVNGSGYTQVVHRAPEAEGQATQKINAGGDASSSGGIASGASSGSSGVTSGGYTSGGDGGGGDSGRSAVPR